MKHRLSLVLSIAAVAIAVLGATPAGNAAHGFLFPAHSVGTRELKDGAVVSGKVKDHSLLSQDFREGQLPVGPQGPQGKPGPQGPQGPQGKQGPAGPVDTSKLLGRTLTVRASKVEETGIAVDYVVCPSGYEAVGGGADSDPAKGWVLDSSPAVGGQAVGDGTSGPADSWRTTVYVLTRELVQWTVVCAKAGA